MRRACTQGRPRTKTQRGIVLIIALVVLVIMTVTGLLMFRNTGTGVEVAGNVGFKQNATSVADLGTESGFKWIYDQRANPNVLNADIPSEAYYATWNDTFDPLTFDWSTAKEVTDNDGTGNRVRYVIHRLCATPGPPTDVTQKCVIPQFTAGLGNGGGVDGGFAPPKAPYYRITARVDGVRGAVSYTQVIML